MSKLTNKEIINEIDNVVALFQMEYFFDILKLQLSNDKNEKKEILQKINDKFYNKIQDKEIR